MVLNGLLSHHIYGRYSRTAWILAGDGSGQPPRNLPLIVFEFGQSSHCLRCLFNNDTYLRLDTYQRALRTHTP